MTFIAYLLLLMVFLMSSLGMGWFVVRKLAISESFKLLAASISSILVWTFSGYIFGYLHIRWASFGLAVLGIAAFIILWKEIKQGWSRFLWQVFHLDKIVLVLGVIGIVTQLLGISGSGASGVYHRLQSSDGLMHIAFTESIKRSFPPEQPGAVGLPITNYHYWSNLYIAEISRIFAIPVDLLFFQITPPIIAVLLFGCILVLGKLLSGSKLVLRLLTFFHFFSGNATYIFTLALHHTFAFHTPAIDHGVIQFYNPPQTYAKLMFLFGSWLWLIYIQKKQVRLLLLAAFVFASLFGFKIYFGIYAALMLGLWHLIEWINKRANIKKLLPELCCLLLFGFVALLIFLPPNKQAGGLFFAPFAWPKILLGQQNIDWNEWWLRLQVYEHFQNIKGIVAMYTIATVVFLVSFGGTRLLGILSIMMVAGTRLQKIWWLANWPITLLFFYIGMNYLQISGGANVFNFFIVSLIVWGIMSAFSLDYLIKRLPKMFSIVLTAAVIIISLPRPVNEVYLLLRSWAYSEGSYTVTQSELAALQALKTLPPGIYQSHPQDLQDYHETPYRSIFSQKQAYLAGAGILDSHNQPIEQRRKQISMLFAAQSPVDFSTQLKQLSINYVFLTDKTQRLLAFDLTRAFTDNSLSLLYKNDSAIIIGPGK